MPGSPPTRLPALLGLALSLALLPGGAGAQDLRAITRNPAALSDAELDARLLFLEERLDALRTRTALWQWGWTGGYSMGIVLGTAQAATADDDDERADAIATAVKGVIGTSRLVFWPHPGRRGADPMRDVEGDSRDARLARLAVGEHLLLEGERRAELKRSWWPHLANLGINLAAGAFVAGFGDPEDAAVSMAVGVAVGEAQIWTQPAAYREDLADYRVRFGMTSRPRFDWQVVPTAGGLALRVTF